MILRILLFGLLLSTTSCIPYKDMVLFRKNNAPLPDIAPMNTVINHNLLVQPNDALSIIVSCYDPLLAAPFNLMDMRTAGNIQSDSPIASFVVDSNGDIDYPVLGKIQVAKKTIPQIRDTLIKRIKPYIKDPSINIRRVNFRITVLGEVTKPGSFNINSERVTVLEALGYAGDLTPHSDRQRVMVIREENGKTTFQKLNLQSADFIRSPYYYLHQNDVVYVDPKKNKKGGVNDPANKYVSWSAAAFSAISTVVAILFLVRD